MTTATDVALGWAVYEHAYGDYQPRGGVVVGYHDNDGDRVYVCMDVMHGRIERFELTADQLDLELAQPPNPSVMRNLARAIDRENGKRKGRVDQYEVYLHQVAAALSEMSL